MSVIKKEIILLLFLIKIALISNCQDSITIKTSFDLKLDSKHILASISPNKDCINCEAGTLSDNPFNHLAVYGIPTLNALINDKYEFKLGLLLEERGYSFGNFTRNNLIVLPYIYLSIDDSLKIFGKQLNFQLVGGDMWDEDVSDKIRLYNIDYQGVNAKIGYGNIWLGFLVVADLINSIGLNLGEIHRFSIEYKKENYRYQLSLNNNIQAVSPSIDDISFSNFFTTRINNIQLLSQFDYKINSAIGNGIAAMTTLNYSRSNLSIANTFRYFNSKYNVGSKNTNVNYISRQEQLYPLKNYNRNISQWALFTNYQNSSLLNYEIVLDYVMDFSDRVNLNTKIDGNLIYDLTNDDIILFPAYDLTVNLHFFSKFKFQIGFTNKHMELFNYFQSSSLSMVPFVKYGFTLDLESINEQDRKMETTTNN